MHSRPITLIRMLPTAVTVVVVDETLSVATNRKLLQVFDDDGTVVVSHVWEKLHPAQCAIYRRNFIAFAFSFFFQFLASASVWQWREYVWVRGTVNPMTIGGYLSTERVNLMRFNFGISRRAIENWPMPTMLIVSTVSRWSVVAFPSLPPSTDTS